ncbi:MAG: sigma-70 family RNA polymerase sigma factor [Fimbriimonadaceae bacterium]|nr:sigma-70 family RNA polymerase sigma factor [Fimbriimonadaceae bacterium]
MWGDDKESAAVRPAFEEQVRRTSRQAYAVARRLTGNAEEAEDLVQESFVRAYRFYHRYDPNLPFASWLFRIMTNLHIDAARRRSRFRLFSLDSQSEATGAAYEPADPADSPETRLLDQEVDASLNLGLRGMNPEFRTALVLSDVEGLSYEEIAEVMECSIGTVRSRIHRARKILREYLTQSAPHLIPPEAGR